MLLVDALTFSNGAPLSSWSWLIHTRINHHTRRQIVLYVIVLYVHSSAVESTTTLELVVILTGIKEARDNQILVLMYVITKYLSTKELTQGAIILAKNYYFHHNPLVLAATSKYRYQERSKLRWDLLEVIQRQNQ